ncbi:hypothetical protein BGZ58_001940 [Dissophora ornata]|nr:hypothetical protein BGZ58_001940 [Dissophora ornata]
MDKPIGGDKYVRTLSHYLRHNQKRLIPIELDAHGNPFSLPNNNNNSHGKSKNSSPVSHGVRSLITPADPMAAVYSGMVNSLWSMGSAVVSSVAPSSFSGSNERPQTIAQERDSFNGAWDGTGTIAADSNARERELYLQAQLKTPIFPMDLYYLLYLLDRFELEGIEIEGWDGSTPRAVGDSNPRVLNASGGNGGLHNNATYSSFPPPTTRPQSIRSFSSTALSTLTLITGWKQWSSAASSKNTDLTIADDVHFIHKFLKRIQGLRLVAKILPGLNFPGKGRIEGYSGDGIMNILDFDQLYDLSSDSKRLQQVLLPLGATFSSLTHLELHKIPPRSVDGWEVLMPTLKSLVVIQAGMGDVYDVLVTAVVESERRRRQRISKERNRAVLIRQEHKESMKDASTITKGRRLGSSGSSSPGSSGSSSAENSQTTSAPSPSLVEGADSMGEDEESILKSINMWPVLRHLSASDNALPELKNQETFSYAQAIVTLDLSHNLLNAPPQSLIHLHNLHNLNLSFNMVSSVQAISHVLGNIAVLDLRGNRLESLCGLERLWNLEKVDVRENELKEAAEVGRLAALPGIREVWAEMNPFCDNQPKYRLEILGVFKANGHDLLLDGTFASFTEKRSIASLSPSSYSTTISSINVINPANIPAATVPVATLAQGLASPPPRITRPDDYMAQDSRTNKSTSANGGSSNTAARHGDGIMTAGSSPSINTNLPTKLTKKKLVKSSKRVQRIVNLDSDHDEDEMDDEAYQQGGDENSGEAAYSKVLGSPAAIGKKKTKKPAAQGSGDGETEKKTKKKVVKKKSQGPVGFTGAVGNKTSNSLGAGLEDDGIDHSECRENHHVHRVAQLEESLNAIQVGNNGHHHHGSPNSSGQPPRGILKKSSGNVGNGHFPAHNGFGLKGPSLNGPGYLFSDEDTAERYKRTVEGIRNEAGSKWLNVLGEMDNESLASRSGSNFDQQAT